MSLTQRTIAVRSGFFFTNIDDITTPLTPLFLQSNPIFMILRAISSWLAWFKISFVPTWITIAASTGIGILHEAGLRIVSIRSRAHLYGVGHWE